MGYGIALVTEGLFSPISVPGLIYHEEDGPISSHVHVTLSYGSGTTFGGHLGYGSIVLTTTKPVIGRIERIDMARQMDITIGPPLFHPTQL